MSSAFPARLDTLTPLHWLGVAAALVSALVHLVLGIGFLPHWMGVLFLLATGGFLGAVVLVLLDVRRRLVYLVGIPFVGVQIVMWAVLNQPTAIADLGVWDVVDKVAQFVLLGVLGALLRRER